MDLSSHGVTDEIQLGCHCDNLGEFFVMQISAAIIILYITILLNIVKSMHDTLTQMVSILRFSRSVIRTSTIRKCQLSCILGITNIHGNTF